LGQTGRLPAAPALSPAEGPALSPVEGPVLSPVEGPARSPVEVRSEGYDLSWFTVAGTTASESNTHSVMGAIGQPDVGPMTNGGGAYAVYSGFWPATDLPISTYLPVVGR